MKNPKVKCSLAVTLDGFTAGINQSFDNPFGDNFDVNLLRRWMFEETEKKNHQQELDYILDAGAFIMGHNMFIPPNRRDNSDWTGWWGNEPPYHAPVFVLSHAKQDPINMAGGTTFTFINDGIISALEMAKSAAGSRDVAISGGAHTVNQYLAAGLIDELWLHILPVTVGNGTQLFEGVPSLILNPVEVSGNHLVTHIKYQIHK